jgi:hypothetical protein
MTCVGARLSNEYGAVGEMSIDRQNQSAPKKFAPVPFKNKNPYYLTWDRTRASAVRSWRLTAEVGRAIAQAFFIFGL